MSQRILALLHWFWRALVKRRMKLADTRTLRDIGVRRGVAEAMTDVKRHHWIS